MKDDNKTKKQLVQELAELRLQNAALKKSESPEKYRSLVENLRDVIYELDGQGVVLYISPAIKDLLGYESSEIVGKNFIELAYKDDLSRRAEWFSELRKGVESPSEFRIINNSGEYKWAQTRVRPIMEDGQFKGARGILIDVTEQRNMEKKLRESEESLRSYLEYAPDGVYMSTLEGNFLYGNLKCEEIIGYRREELIGKNLLELNILPEKSLNKAAQLLQANIEGKSTGPDEIELISKEGRIIPVEISTSVVQRTGQRIILAFVRDIADRKRAESEIQALARFPSENPNPIFRIARDGTLLYVNEASLSQLPDWHLQAGRSAPSTMQDVASQALTSGETRLFDLEHRGRAYSFFVAPFADAGYANMYGLDITDRKRSERALRESEEKYRWMLDNMADVITVMDMNLRFTYVSPSIMGMRGYTAEEATAQTLEQVMTPESLQISAKVFEEEMKLEASGTADPDRIRIVEVEQYRKDGSIVLMENHLSFMRDETKKPVGIISVSHDITARKRSEAKLRQQTDAMDAAIDGMAILNEAGEFVYVNKAHVRLYGYDVAGELIGKPWRILYDPNSLQRFEQEVMPELGRIGNWHGEAIGTKKNGSKFPQELSLTGMANGGLICVVRDITDRKKSEEELRLSEERFRRIFEEGPVGLGIQRPDHTIIAANKILCELLGYTEQELTGQSATDITYEEDREKSKELLGQLFADGTPVYRLEKRYIRKDGTILWANASISAIHGQEGNVLYGLAIIEDLTEGRKAADKIHLLAYYDSLTGLPNRVFHKELIKRSVEHAQRHKEIFSLIYIGLDNFQRINDTLGHSTGDLLLKAVADRLTNVLRKSDYVARSDEHEAVNVVSRVGGDEFIVLAHDLNQAQDAAKASRRLLAEMSIPYELNGHEVFLTVSIGIALYPDDGTEVDDLLKNAEKAMRYSKSEGKNSYHFYSSSMHSSVLGLLTMENDLHKALERNELVLYYQPQVDAASRMVTGMEALIRWKHPTKGLIPPMQFIPLAETSGLIIPIGEFVIRTACRQIKKWQEAGYKQMKIALNVSGRQFDQQNLIEIVQEALQDTLISPQCLEVEITESTIMRNPEKAILILNELKAMGIRIAIDDFGTGYSSLSYLKRLPVLDFLKIDQSFVMGLVSDPRDQAIVRAIIAMAHSLKLKTIAEGVETEEQLSFLREHACDEIQGYLFSRPLPVEEIPGILAKGYL
jgi:diguanylate cyclase (GGDEF)-like protein/PAS domain S-box-containing protein